MNLKDLPFNWFDVVVLAVIITGVVRGRKLGMSEELMNVIKWITVLVGCSFAYAPLGQFLADSSPLSLLACYLIVYAVVAVVILSLFALVKHSIGGKLIGSDIFGQAEYYLGMGSGMVRFVCILLAGLALMNSRLYTQAEVRAKENFQNDVYGSTYFPTFPFIQASIFEKSLVGPWVKQNLSFLLIQPTPYADKQLHQKEFAVP
jgi:uncharacterized membrane protein required for colicin V production